jgi:hypothetical protein
MGLFSQQFPLPAIPDHYQNPGTQQEIGLAFPSVPAY